MGSFLNISLVDIIRILVFRQDVVENKRELIRKSLIKVRFIKKPINLLKGQ